MYKKHSTSTNQAISAKNTPKKGPLSRNSSSGSIASKNGKLSAAKLADNRKTQGKENLSTNEITKQTNAKGLKKIRQKVQKSVYEINTQQKKPLKSEENNLPYKASGQRGVKSTSFGYLPKSSQSNSLMNKNKKSQQEKSINKDKSRTDLSNGKFRNKVKENANLKEKEVKMERVLNEVNESSKQQSELFEKVEIQTKYNKQLMISMFKIGRKLTSSNLSITFQALQLQTNCMYCLKIFEKALIKQQGLEEQIMTELKFRKNHHGRNSQKLITFFDDEVYIYFIEEHLIGFGSIEKDLKVKKKLSEQDSGALFRQVLDITKSIHDESFIHRDIRIQNLVNCFGIAKLIDFSSVASLQVKSQRDTFCGSPKYTPPQIFSGQTYGCEIDMWCLGLFLYELTTGKLPFSTQQFNRKCENILFPIALSNECVDLIGRLLSKKESRMKIEEVYMHEWTNKWDLDGLVGKQIWEFWHQ